MHDVHTVSANDICEIEKQGVSTEYIEGGTHKVLSGVTAIVQQEPGGFWVSDRAETGGLASVYPNYEYPMTCENKHWEIQEEVPGFQIEDIRGRVKKKYVAFEGKFLRRLIRC